MTEYITKDDAMRALGVDRHNWTSPNNAEAWWACGEMREAIRKAIESLPTVDAEPVRHGHWKPASRSKNDKSRIYQCTECGNFLDFHGVNAGRGDGNYCPNCGARMDEDDWEEPEINPCRGCEDYDGRGGCKSNGGCGAEIDEVKDE